MEPLLREVADTVADACELVAIGVIALGAAEALARTVLGWRAYGDLKLKKDIWLRFAAAIVLALEFALAADIARTAVAPTWTDIGKLGAIATIRTLLNLFLERDLEAARQMGRTSEPA